MFNHSTTGAADYEQEERYKLLYGQLVQMKQTQYHRSCPTTLIVRYSHDPMEDWKEVDISERGRHLSLDQIPWDKLYAEGDKKINPR